MSAGLSLAAARASSSLSHDSESESSSLGREIVPWFPCRCTSDSDGAHGNLVLSLSSLG